MKYWLDTNGRPTEPGQHYDLAKQALAARGIRPQALRNNKQSRGSLMFQADYASAYAEMFKLGYLRVNELDTVLYVENPTISRAVYLPRAQRVFIEDKQLAGKTLSFNEDKFVETRLGRRNASEIVEKLVA